MRRKYLKEITALTIPLFFNAILINMNFTIDSLMLGRANELYLAAVGIATRPTIIMTIAFFALNIGTAARISRAKGEGEQTQANEALRQGLFMTLILVILISVLYIGFNRQIIGLMTGGSGDVVIIRMAEQYLKLMTIGLLPFAISACFSKMLIAVKKTRQALFITIASVITNGLFNYLLIYGVLGFPALGLLGSALANILANLVSLTIGLRYLLSKKYFIYLDLRKKFRIHKEIFAEISKISIPAVFERVFVQVGMLITMRWVIGLGTDSIVGNQILANLTTMPFLVADSFAVAISTLSGIMIGEKNIEGLRRYVRCAGVLAVGIGVMLAIVFYVFGQTIIGFYVQDTGIIRHTYQVLSLYILIIPIQALGLIICGSLWGQGQTRWTAASMFIGVGVLRPVVAWVLIEKYGLGLSGYWLAICFDELIRCGFVLVAYRIVLRRQGRVFSDKE